MKFITVTELKQRATQIVSEIESKRRKIVITKNGKPVVVMKPACEEAFRYIIPKNKAELKEYIKLTRPDFKVIEHKKK